MALASVLLAALSLVSIALAVPTLPIPGVGLLFAFGAPTLAFAGIVAGGVAVGRAKRRQSSTALAVAGVIASLLSLVPALFTAVTLGLLNVLFTAGPIDVHRSFQVHTQHGGAPLGAFAGAPAPPPAEPAPAPPRAPGSPPPAFPPPPLEPGRAP
jgi:hypothetical protein